MRKLFYPIMILCAMLAQTGIATAQQKCEGPADLCQQVLDLQQALKHQKELSAGKAIVAQQNTEQATEQEDGKLVKFIAFSATLAVILKLIVSGLKSWKGLFQTDKQKAWLRLALVGLGFIAFLATNFGLGLPLVQSFILAAFGPGSILFHELTKIVPVLRGQTKYEEIDPDGDPTDVG